MKLCQIEVCEVSIEISHKLTKYLWGFGQSDPLQKIKPYITFTSLDIYMILIVKVDFDMEIVKLTTIYEENSNLDHAQI